MNEQGRQHTVDVERESTFRDFMENGMVPLHMVAADGTILWANRAELDMMGYSAGDYIGRNIADFHVDRATIDELLSRLAAGEQVVDFGSRLRARDGSIRDVAITSSVCFENGRFLHTWCFTRELSAPRGLSNLQQQYAAVVEWTDDAIITDDLQGIIRSWNPGAERVYGYSASEAIGKPIRVLLPEELHDEAASLLRRTMAGERIVNYRTRRIRKDGKVLTVSLTVSPVRDEQGELVGASRITRDITEQAAAEGAQAELHRQLLLLVEASGVLLASPQPEAVVETTLATASHVIEADAYALWRKSTDGWRLASSRGLTQAYGSYIPLSDETSDPFDGQSLVVEDVFATPVVRNREQIYAAEGIRSLLAVPLLIGGTPSATIVFYYRQQRRFGDAEIRVAQALGNIAAGALSTAELYTRESRLREEAEAAERRADLLARVGEILASSLDEGQTLQRIAGLLIPGFAAGCRIDILREAGVMECAAAAGLDEAPKALSEEDPGTAALRSGDSVLVTAGGDTAYLRELRQMGISSVLAVPMVLHERTLGTVTVARVTEFSAADKVIVEEITRRIAIWVDNSRLHAALRERERRLRVAQSAAGIGIWDWELATDRVTWTPEVYEMYGVPAGSVQPSVSAWWQSTLPADRERVMQELQTALETSENYQTEFRITRKRGDLAWLLCRARILRDPSGKATRLLGVNMDITSQKAAEERIAFLLHLEDTTRTLAEPAEIVQAAAELLGQHLQADRCAYADIEDEEYFNISGNYTAGVQSIVGRYRVDAFGLFFARTFREGESWVVADSETDERIEEDSRASYRATAIRSVICVPLHRGGRLVAAMAVHCRIARKWRDDEVDVVRQVASRCWESIERVRVARVLRESEGRFRQLSDAVPAFVWVTNGDGSLAYFNSRWYEYTGLTVEQSMGTGWVQALHPDDVDRVLQCWNTARAEATPYVVECRYRSAAGEYRWYMARALPASDGEGRVTRWFGTSTDVEDAKRAEDKLRKANAELEEFAYVASHDLQEPLRMVHAYTQLLLRQPDPRPEAIQYGEYIRQGVRRMEQLIHDLLSYSRTIHADEQEVEAADLNEALRQAVEVLENSIAEADATVEAQPLQVVNADTAQLALVFQNLISNSIKYSKADVPARIVITSEVRDGQAFISVADNGIGFQQRYARQIFGLFRRLHKQEYPGTGLGLAICQRVVQRYGGQIRAEGRPGEGATFTFNLPLAVGMQRTSAAEAPPIMN